MRALAVLTVRNEAAFLIEWLAHHKAVGFTDFLVFSNDCEDGTDTLLDQLEAQGHLSHVRNDGPHEGGIQWTALKKADKHPLVKAADWILAMDVDEFVNIHVGDGTLGALFEAVPDATAITLTWRLFGNAGKARYADTPMTETFVHAAPAVLHWPWRASMFKTLFRNDGAYKKLGVHRPRSPVAEKLKDSHWVDSAGRVLGDQFKKRRLFSDFGQDNFGLVQLNHYPLGAMESYVVKAFRGRAVHSDDMLGMDYWVERNFSAEEDQTIARYKAARDKITADIRSIASIAQLHDAGVAWRKAKFEALMLEEPYRALFGRLLMAGPTRPINPKASQFMRAYANQARLNQT